MDEDLKREFDSLCNDLGLTMTAAFTIFAKTVVRRQRIPFDIAKDVPNTETIAAIEEVHAMKKDPNKRLYTNFNELLKEVEADV
jgi:DNA-damage-inducible protein J